MGEEYVPTAKMFKGHTSTNRLTTLYLQTSRRANALCQLTKGLGITLLTIYKLHSPWTASRMPPNKHTRPRKHTRSQRQPIGVILGTEEVWQASWGRCTGVVVVTGVAWSAEAGRVAGWAFQGVWLACVGEGREDALVWATLAVTSIP